MPNEIRSTDEKTKYCSVITLDGEIFSDPSEHLVELLYRAIRPEIAEREKYIFKKNHLMASRHVVNDYA